MQFKVDRASNCGIMYGRDKPCKDAFVVEIFDKVDGLQKIWCIDIDTLEELMKLIVETDSLVIVGTESITIYDGNIE